MACARNSVHHETTSHRTQKEAVRYLKGSILNWYPDVRGDIVDIKEAAEYISKNTESYTWSAHSKSFTFLKNQVDYSNATIAGIVTYKNGEQIGGHVVVITGYYISNEDNDINYYDPADGTFNTCSYSEFCDGYIRDRQYEATCYNNES